VCESLSLWLNSLTSGSVRFLVASLPYAVSTETASQWTQDAHSQFQTLFHLLGVKHHKKNYSKYMAKIKSSMLNNLRAIDMILKILWVTRKIYLEENFLDETEEHGFAVRRGVALLIFHTYSVLQWNATLPEGQFASNLISKLFYLVVLVFRYFRNSVSCQTFTEIFALWNRRVRFLACNWTNMISYPLFSNLTLW